MAEDFAALGNKIAVKELEAEQEGVIVMPDTAKSGPNKRGEVLSVGEGGIAMDGHRIPPLLERGEKVVFWVHEDHKPIEVGGVEFYVIEESNILGRIVDV